jgi:release factor glutamine methyltransferase
LTLQEALSAAQALPLDRLDAQRLLLHVLATTASDSSGGPRKDSGNDLQGEPRGRAWLLAHDDEVLPPAAQRQFEALTARRAVGEPLAYLTGFQSFYGLEFAVNPAVLIPRPDTETLVDWALALPLQGAQGTATPQVLDMGTGSGAIALALKHSRALWQVTATDASPSALAVAQSNAQRLGLAIGFLQSDWFEALGPPAAQGAPQLFNLIVSNPPYIVEGDVHLPALRHEPASALTSGADGLADIRRIIALAPAHLHPGGWLLLEHGYDQASAVRALLVQAGFADVQSRCDLNGIERCSGGQFLF